MVDLRAWLAEHARVCNAIIWQDSGGLKSFTSWPQNLQQDLFAAVDLYLGGGAPAVNPVPPNVLTFADDAVPDTALAPQDAWQVYCAYTAHSLVMDISGQFTWHLDDYADEDLLRLLSSDTMMHLVNGNYHLDPYRFRVTPGPPEVALALLVSNGLIVDRRDDSTGLILQWCRDNLSHFTGEATAANMEAIWQYRGWPPMTAILNGTSDSNHPEFGVQHWTAGCWGTTGFLRALLRAANVPCWSAITHDGQLPGHSLPYFTAENAYLSHGDDPYNQITKAVPEITGRDLMIGQSDFDARFGPNPTSANVGYRVWELGIGEVWRAQWTAGWTSFVPLQLGDVAHYLAYKIGDGEVTIDRIRPGGQDVDQVWGAGWTTGWSSFAPFTLNGAPHYLAYKISTGEVRIDRVRPTGQDVDTLWAGTWSTGWSSFVPFTLGGQPYYLIYKITTGDVAMERVRPDGSGVDLIWSGTWTQDWTGFAVVPTPTPLLLSSKSDIGYTAVDQIGADGSDQPLWTGAEPPGWSAMMPFDAAGRPGTVLLYNQQTGALKIVEVSRAGLTAVYTGQWTTDWTAIVPLSAYGRAWYLTYKVVEGTVTINHLCG